LIDQRQEFIRRVGVAPINALENDGEFAHGGRVAESCGGMKHERSAEIFYPICCAASSRARRIKSKSVARSPKRNRGNPLCCWPSNSPGPRSFKSASAMRKPSLVS